MSTSKPVGSFCHVCAAIVELGDESVPFAELQSRFTQHMVAHSQADLARCIQQLTCDTAQRDELRRIPYWAMPHA